MTATYWLRVRRSLWADADTLRWPAGITLGPILDEDAELELHGTEVEWSVRLRTDDVVEVVDRRVVGVRGTGGEA